MIPHNMDDPEAQVSHRWFAIMPYMPSAFFHVKPGPRAFRFLPLIYLPSSCRQLLLTLSAIWCAKWFAVLPRFDDLSTFALRNFHSPASAPSSSLYCCLSPWMRLMKPPTFHIPFLQTRIAPLSLQRPPTPLLRH